MGVLQGEHARVLPGRPALSNLRQNACERFAELLGAAPTGVVRAPGRVNLIGEHTDYNDGFVMPMAIDRAVWIAFSARTDRRVRAYSQQLDATAEFDLNALHKGNGWSEYLKGMAWALSEEAYALEGFDGVIVSDVPVGSGLSSSAALELATAAAFHNVSEFKWDAVKIATLGQRAENEWVGANTGIMDQLISATGKQGFAQLIDCRTLALTPVALPTGTCIVIMDTMTRHSHVGSEYNERRAQCEKAAHILNVSALRDATWESVTSNESALGDLPYRRAKHVVSENARTLQAADAMRQGDARALGSLMNDSHNSLRDDFEVTNDALNVMVECARSASGCYGARMTGGGFGGCAIALVDVLRAEAFTACVRENYAKRLGKTPQIFACQASDGAGSV